MADAYQLETTIDRYLLEDGLGVYLLEQQPPDDSAGKIHVIQQIQSAGWRA